MSRIPEKVTYEVRNPPEEDLIFREIEAKYRYQKLLSRMIHKINSHNGHETAMLEEEQEKKEKTRYLPSCMESASIRIK